jgi:hypothetical protein
MAADLRNVLSICLNAQWIAEIGRGARRIVITPHFAGLSKGGSPTISAAGVASSAPPALASDFSRNEIPTEAEREVC